MNLSTFLSSCILLSINLIFWGCGSNGSTGQSQGATVSLQAAIKDGTNMSIFPSYSSVNSWGPEMSFNLKSAVNSNAGSMASDVTITEEIISYEYVPSLAIPSGAGSTLTIPPLYKYSQLIVPAGSSAAWDSVSMLTPLQKQYVKANVALPTGGQLGYVIRVTFNGFENKNGNPISVSTTGNMYIVN